MMKKITRKIPINSVDASYMVDATTGYIRINKFAAETANEFIESAKKLKNRKNLLTYFLFLLY